MTPAGGSNIIRFPGGRERGDALVLRVELLLAPRPVWRRLLLEETATFWDVHVAIQDAFGWGDRHLHQFTVDDPVSGGSLRFGIPDDSGFHGAVEVLAGWEHRPARYLRRDAAAALYLYDFGEERQHAVELEGVRRGEDPLDLPRCEDGAGWPPAEDDGPGAPAEDQAFVAAAVHFSDPRRHWQGKFGHD